MSVFDVSSVLPVPNKAILCIHDKKLCSERSGLVNLAVLMLQMRRTERIK